MTSPLRTVLNYFDHQTAPLSFQQMAQQMQLEPGVLREMLDYWVRKGKLREVNGTGQACTTCGSHGACPFVVSLPRYYERVDDKTGRADDAPCACGGGCHN